MNGIFSAQSAKLLACEAVSLLTSTYSLTHPLFCCP